MAPTQAIVLIFTSEKGKCLFWALLGVGSSTETSRVCNVPLEVCVDLLIYSAIANCRAIANWWLPATEAAF